jgi:hypothetical protein
MNPRPNVTPARVMPQVIPKGSKPITPTINETIHKPIPRLAEYEGLGGSRTQSTRRASNYAKAMASW